MAGIRPDPAREVRELLAAGQTDAAARLLDRALESDPGCPELLTLRGQVALSRGDLGAARRDLERAHAGMPEDPGVLHALAGVCHAQGEDDTAEGYLQTAVAGAPDRAAIWYSLGLVRHSAGRYQTALGAYDRALALAPQLAAAAVGRAKVRQILGDLDGAAAGFREVLEAHPGHPEATAGLAAQMLIRGEYEAGLALIDGLGPRQPLDWELSLIRARLLRAAGRPQEALTSLRPLDTARMTVTGRRSLHYLLGELCDALGRYDDAFRHVRAANRLKPGHFDATRHQRRIAGTRATWTRLALARLDGACDPADSPIFIVGMPRSGTTLVEHILAAHPDVHAAGELSVIADLARGWRGSADVLSPATLTPAALRQAASDYLGVANPDHSRRCTDKMPSNFEYLGLIQLLLPGARVVHCRRHPLDTALSCYFQDFSAPALAWSDRLADIAVYYETYVELMAHWQDVVDLPILDLDYEQLVTEPDTQIRRLLEFAGLPWHEACLAHHRAERVSATASHRQARRPIYRDSVGRHVAYREHLGSLASLMEDARGR